VTVYDISAPHDLRVALKKPVINTAEIDSMLADPDADEAVKRQLLADVEPQGYQRPRRECPTNCVGIRSRKEIDVEHNHNQVG
jgi:hypothetical protein